jgi:hypothetical protein
MTADMVLALQTVLCALILTYQLRRGIGTTELMEVGMIDPKSNALRLLCVHEASSRDVARAEMKKVANFIHNWLYGAEPTVELNPQMVRVESDRARFDLSRKTFLN